MLLELWAYVGELLSIYDKAIADETYVRTAKLRPSLRRSIALLGYVPRPAVAATADLAILADGARPVVLPVGTGFRSGEFDGEAPQVFEVIEPATVHPALDRWPLAAPIATTLSGTTSSLLFDPASIRFAAGDHIAIELGIAAPPLIRKALKLDRLVDGKRRLARATLDQPIDAGAGVPIANIRVRRGDRVVRLHLPSGTPASVFIGAIGAWFVLDGIYPEAQRGARILVERDGELRWFTVALRGEVDVSSGPGQPQLTISTPAGNVTVPPQPPPLTSKTAVITFDNLDDPARKADPASPNWAGATADGFKLHLPLVETGRVAGATRSTLLPGDALIAGGLRAPIGSVAATDRLALRDAESTGIVIGGGVDWTAPQLVADPAATWAPLAVPIEAFGNIVTVVRGETVDDESLGVGDAAQPSQAFQLAKKPLTYVAVPGGDGGVRSTLRIWVDSLEWYEVPNFFGYGPDAQVFVIRQDDAGESIATFGDGRRGARLPTGAAVIARYRFGAGAKAPPSGSIAQLAKPVPGVRSVVAPTAASGGADAEPAASLRTLAPRSALLLGRAISIDDMEVAARLVPGVVTARADWQWDGTAQRPVVKVWYVGAADLAAKVSARLRALSDPSTPIHASVATAIAVSVAIDLELDPRRIATDVLAAVDAALRGEGGSLTPAVLGIGQPLIRSRLVASLFDVPGVTGVRGIVWAGAPLVDYGVDPGVGAYFDATSNLAITGS
jgi:hypothetical protein